MSKHLDGRSMGRHAGGKVSTRNNRADVSVLFDESERDAGGETDDRLYVVFLARCES